MRSRAMSMPTRRHIAAIVGNRARTRSASRCCSVRNTGPPDASISRTMPRATTSRGARSPAASYRCMKVSPRPFTSFAPSPRSASDIRNLRRARQAERGRVKLDELEIGDARSGMPRQGDAVARRDRGIGRFAEDLSCTAGGQQHPRSAHGPGHPTVVEVFDAGHATVCDDHCRHEGVVHRVDAGQRRHAFPHRPGDFATRGIARVENPVDAVGRFEAEDQVAVRRRDRSGHPTPSVRGRSVALQRRARARPTRRTVLRPPRACRQRAVPRCRRGPSPPRCRPVRNRCCSRWPRPWSG